MRSTAKDSKYKAEKEKAKQLWQEYAQNKSSKTRDSLIKQYAYLVKWVVGRIPYIESGDFDREDLQSYGSIGLIESVDRYKPDSNCSFESFAITRIRGAIFDYLRQRDVLSRGGRQRVKGYQKAQDKLERSLGRSPTAEEVRAEMGLSPEDFHKIQKEASLMVFSLDEPQERDSSDDSRASVVDNIASQDESQEEKLEKASLKKEMAKAIDALPERERLVVALYHYQRLTFKEIGAILEVSESRASQIHMKALQKLRIILKDKDL